MRAVTQTVTGGPEVLRVTDLPSPRPSPHEVVVQAGALGVNPVDLGIRAGRFDHLGSPPFILGWDVAGVVVEVGREVRRWRVGDRVFGMPHFPAAASAYAELIGAPESELAATPDDLSDIEAAALPLAGLTAYQALCRVEVTQAGDRVLIPAAGGGVGHLAVQIAKARGAHVTAVVSPGKIDFAHRIGADEVVDYTGRGLDGLAPADVALDPFGGRHTAAILEVTAPGGGIVSLLPFDPADERAARLRGVRLRRIRVTPSGHDLEQLAAWVSAGVLRPHVAETFSLQEAGNAHRALAAGVTGKIVLVP